MLLKRDTVYAVRKYKAVEPEKCCAIKITFLIDREKQIYCPFNLKVNGQKDGTLAHGFYQGTQQICRDIHFDNENCTDKKKQSGDGKQLIFHGCP